MDKHTPEPWFYAPGEGCDDDKIVITCPKRERTSFVEIAAIRTGYVLHVDMEQEANAARIVACVNALAGVPNEALADDCWNKMKADRDELLAAASRVTAAFRAHGESTPFTRESDRTRIECENSMTALDSLVKVKL